MNLYEAREAIAAILDQIPKGALPEPTRVEPGRDNKWGDCYWFGCHGFYLGAARDGKGDPVPSQHRSGAINDLFDRESMQRLENEFWDSKSEVSA